MSQKTPSQMMTRAQQVVHAEDLHIQACKGPGRNVIVSADVEGFGNVEIVSIPGKRRGRGGTAHVLAEALNSCMDCSGTFPNIGVGDGYVLVKLPRDHAEHVLETERKRRSERNVFIKLGLE